ncbi:uncharacterized protein AB675_5862 [Cyphellophora attinorum]|uniref:Uncharacterized protein n=1 Tax=Cyphellophora attinorum TaxID=1664694 RepID=A0A0N1H7A4_9EURO|nr:uncharacterized protein AB675_5862 [Phialophora attinorum]KPI38795.1 hypothetical protein AB675_5862 [Phialophora attinorum]
MAPSTLKSKAQESLRSNPSALGDPISIKAETSPSEHDLDADQKNEGADQKSGKATPGQPKDGKKPLKELAKENPTMLGDPVSLKAETSDRIPKPEEAGAKTQGKDSKL